MSKKIHAADTTPLHRTPEELRKARKEIFDREKEYMQSRTHFKMKIEDKGPIGITIFGDPHADNHATNLEKLYEYVSYIKNTDGMYAMCVGDLVDGWIGKLARLWSLQGVTGSESLVIVRDLFHPIKDKMLMMVGGNHCSFTKNVLDLGVLDELRKDLNVSAFQDAARVVIQKPDIEKDIIVNIRHKCRGNSIYNTAHGQMRQARFMDPYADIIVSGHVHQSGFGIVSHPYARDQQSGEIRENIIHCAQVTAFKECDPYRDFNDYQQSTYLQAPTFLLMPDNYGLSRAYQIMMIPHPKMAADLITRLRDPQTPAIKTRPRNGLKLVA